MLRAADLSRVFVSKSGERTVALDRVSLDVGQREFVSIVGPSGCGKSTLMAIVGGVIEASSGTVTLNGRSEQRGGRHVGMIFQEPLLLPYRTILQNVLLPAVIYKLPEEPALVRAQDLLRLVGLEGFGDRYPHELSGGMQQRAAIGRGLMHDPAIVLMDEPFGALDAMTRENMNLELMDIWQQASKTIIFITHSIPEAVFLSDRVVVMSPRPGRIVDVVEVNLPRPRNIVMQSSSEFGALTLRIRKSIGVRGVAD
jgi:NitT/TauT family transport system ATP-binding protein